MDRAVRGEHHYLLCRQCIYRLVADSSAIAMRRFLMMHHLELLLERQQNKSGHCPDMLHKISLRGFARFYQTLFLIYYAFY